VPAVCEYLILCDLIDLNKGEAWASGGLMRQIKEKNRERLDGLNL
jgi:hypothetical protein